MTNAEREFIKVLHLAVQDKYYIVPQVQLSNLVQVKKGEWDYKHKNKINLKSVDFVLFDKEYFTPQVVVEAVMEKAGIKIVHVKWAKSYSVETLANYLK